MVYIILFFFSNLIQSWRLLSKFKKVMPYLQQTLQCKDAGVVKSWMIGGDKKHSNVQTQGKI